MTTRFFIIVLFVYALYYLIMIVYDRYFKKEKALPDEEDKQEFSLAEMADNTITNVDFDEVEQMTTSSKVEVSEDEIFSSATDSEPSEEPSSEDLEALKRKYEEEERLEAEPEADITADITDTTATSNTGGEAPLLTPIDKEEILKKSRERFKNMLSLAETSVQVLVNESGDKIYKAQI